MPPFPDDLFQSALGHHRSGLYQDAHRLYQEVLETFPDHPETLHLFGLLKHQVGQSQIGLDLIDSAIAFDNSQAPFHYNRGVVLHALSRNEEAEQAYRACLERDAGQVSAWVNLGNLLADRGRFAEAIDCHQNALKLEPEYAEHHVRVARAFRLAGEIEKCLAHLGCAVSLAPDNETAWSALLFSSHYQPGIDLGELARRHQAWAGRLAPPVQLHERSAPSQSAPLRVGFLSPDLGNHPVGIFLAPLLERLQHHPRLVTVCFNDRKGSDEFLARNHRLANEWKEVADLPEEGLEALLRESQLDALIELTGHTDNNRLPVLALKPVPIQLTWAGYVGTTGLEAIDYLVTDSFHTPDGAELRYAETLLRFPCGYIAWEAPAYAPMPGPLPLLEKGYPTFGCLNNPSKLTGETLFLWAELLRRIPDSRLLLKYKGMDDPAVINRVLGLLAVGGIAPERVTMRGQTNHLQHLSTFSEVDVALDPRPYSGGLSTCEALWMGVPVVTWPGDTFASRHSLSHLTNAGLADTVAPDHESYLAIAEKLVADPESLAARRNSMRERMARSPLCDLDAFAEDFVTALATVAGRDLSP